MEMSLIKTEIEIMDTQIIETSDKIIGQMSEDQGMLINRKEVISFQPMHEAKISQ